MTIDMLPCTLEEDSKKVKVI